MNRNSQSHFAQLPTVEIQRSKSIMPFDVKTSFNVGELIPFYLDMEVYPGDTFKISTSIVARASTPINPTMDNAYLDTYYFAIPYRILWTHLKEFMGENTTGAWTQTTEYTIPQIITPENGWDTHTVADYMGLPIGVNIGKVSAMPFRAYTKVYNEYFRDQNLIAPADEITSDVDTQGYNGENAFASARGGKPFKVAKFHDYFTSCLPAPQKGDPIEIPISAQTAPIIATRSEPLYVSGASGTNPTTLKISADPQDTNPIHVLANSGLERNTLYIQNGAGLLADLTNAYATSINTLREAVAAQRILEKDARGGTRYREVIFNHFGVTSPDARQQIPEYLGGKRIPLNISQVNQTSSTDNTSPLGETAGFSLTTDINEDFIKSFTEHTIILGLCCVRTEQSYQQGINRSWSKKRRLDFYWPSLAHLGEQAVLNKELYATGTDTDNQTWGFQERWAELRYKPNLITGAMRSTYAQPLDSWHYGAKFDSQPVLSQYFIEEPKEYFGRTLAVTDEDQIIMDAFITVEATRPMPLYSVPGLMDHF